MYIEKTKVESLQQIEEGIFLIKVSAPQIASKAKPGQFCNIKVSENDFPLLRRPFSICDVENDFVYFMFDIHGEGTRMLSNKNKGDVLDILGPLGNGFIFEGDFETAVIIAGGLGAAPFPFLLKKIDPNKNVLSFVGARTKNLLIKYQLKNIHLSTDDGSEGFHGTVIKYLESKKEIWQNKKIRIFACGPNPMLKALQEFSIQEKIDCQISVECAMACGFGICQGCPVEKRDGEGFLLVCKDGPVFNANEIKL